MVSKLQDKLDDIENKVSDCIFVGEYNESDTASKSVLPKPTGKKLVIEFKQKKVRVKR